MIVEDELVRICKKVGRQNFSVCREERKEKTDRLDHYSEIHIREGKEGPLEYKARGLNTSSSSSSSCGAAAQRGPWPPHS